MKYSWLLLFMHTGPKTLKTSLSNREKSVWPCFAALTSPSQNLALCVHIQEQKNPLSARSNPFPGWGQSLETFLRVAHQLCVCPGTETHLDWCYLGLDALPGGQQPKSALPRLSPAVCRSKGLHTPRQSAKPPTVPYTYSDFTFE